MKFVLYHWNSLSMNDIESCLVESGHEVDCIHYVFSDFDKDDAFEERLETLLEKKRYDAVISFDFFQIISRVCNRIGVAYISWVWDSPQINLYSKEVFNSCNYIFLFDKEVYDDLIELGVETLYYLPLAVNVKRLDKIIISKEERRTYENDISFVGSLYDKTNLYDVINTLPDQLKEYFDELMEKQSRVNGIELLEQGLTEEKLNEFLEFVHLDMGKEYLSTTRKTVLNRVFATKVSNIERVRMVQELSNKYYFKLYTGSDVTNIEGVKSCGYVDYFTVMPKVFKLSKININSTLRTIKTGIPLRVLDIMGAGGFVLTNYQEDLDLFFENGVDLVYYHTEDEMYHLIDYYLEHDEERNEIAKNGYEKVKKYHNYRVRLDYILSIVFEGASKNNYLGVERQGVTSVPDYTIEEEFKELEDNIWNLLVQGKVMEAYNTFALFTRRNPTLDSKIYSEWLQYESLLRICMKELQIEGKSSILMLCSDNGIRVMERIKKVINHIEVVTNEDMRTGYDSICDDILCGELTCLQLIEILLTINKDSVKHLNIIADIMMQHKSYDKVLPFLIEAEEMEPDNKDTISSLVRILSYLGEEELAAEYREKL